MSRPLCINCEHFWRRAIQTDPRLPSCFCDRPIGKTKPNLVGGGERVVPLRANPFTERKAGRALFGLGRERCGPSGKFFQEAAPKAPPRGGSGAHK